MMLRPAIASYSAASSRCVRQALDVRTLEVVASVARSPQRSADVPDGVLTELVVMHVLKERAGWVTLDTAVFLRDDLARILGAVAPIARELAQRMSG